MFGAITAMESRLPSFYNLLESGLVLMFIPVLNHLLLPCIPTASMKRRIGVGALFFLLSAALGFLVNIKMNSISDSLQLFWLSTPIILFAIADTLLFVSGE